MDRHGFFTVRDVVDYAYCPRSIYFRYCIGAGKEETPKMERGRWMHVAFTSKSRRAKMVKELPGYRRRYRVRLSSEKLGISTVVDCILFSGTEAYPVEYKSTAAPKVLYNTHRYQATAQALLIEEVLGKNVPWAYLKYSDGTILRLTMGDKLKERVMGILWDMEDIVRRECIPRATNSKRKCTGCFYRNLCHGV
jgi:CRISPR-associated protein Cas4